MNADVLLRDMSLRRTAVTAADSGSTRQHTADRPDIRRSDRLGQFQPTASTSSQMATQGRTVALDPGTPRCVTHHCHVLPASHVSQRRQQAAPQLLAAPFMT